MLGGRRGHERPHGHIPRDVRPTAVHPDRSTANRTGLHRRPVNTGRAGLIVRLGPLLPRGLPGARRRQQLGVRRRSLARTARPTCCPAISPAVAGQPVESNGAPTCIVLVWPHVYRFQPDHAVRVQLAGELSGLPSGPGGPRPFAMLTFRCMSRSAGEGCADGRDECLQCGERGLGGVVVS